MNQEFPPHFILGTGDADLQVIGEANTRKFEDSQPTMWNHFARTSDVVFEHQTPDVGIDRYERWKEDIALMEDLGIEHYRTSVSMARILTEDGKVNQKAVDWYKRYFEGLAEANINLYLTLYHWELPEALDKKGGWTNRETVDHLVRHAEVVGKELGEYPREVFLINEPWCASLLSYHLGFHAPGHHSLREGLRAAHNVLLAQGRMYDAVSATAPDVKISTVYNIIPAYPASRAPEDERTARVADGYVNRWFLDPLYKGEYPQDMVELYCKRMPAFSEEDLKEIQIGAKLNTLGINYYNGAMIASDPGQELGYHEVLRPEGKTTGLGWPIFEPPQYPEGLHDLLERLHTDYAPHGLKRLIVTENGMAHASEWDRKATVIDDPERIAYLEEHIRQVKKAVDEGVPVAGYFVWTLMDNYEWQQGYKHESAFGMVYVDRTSLKRVPKTSALWYKEFLKQK